MELKELSYLEIMKVLEEMQDFVGGKIDQVYMPAKKEVLLQLHIPNIGKKIIRILVPNFMYLTTYKPEGQFPPGYCVFLRKKIKNARIKSIKQIPNERIVVIELTTKDATYELFIELFLKGNVILCEDKKIISPLENQKWRDRTIRGGVEYIYTKNESMSLIEELSIPLVKYLATEMNLGGKYSEEICKRADVDKNAKKLSKEDVSKIEKEIKKLTTSKPKGYVYKQGNNLKAITPVEMKIYSELEVEQFDSYNEALNSVHTEVQKTKVEKAKTSKSDLKKKKYETIISAQGKQLNSIHKKIEDSTKKGEAIYNNYNLVSDILKEISAAREKFSWKEIQEKLKGHKVIKKIKPKEGKLILELE
jgi:predicted ribosome quality control (RQC) complex YloA/Tae2 family protein